MNCTPCIIRMGMIVRQPRWLQGLYRRHFFALEAIFLALLAVTSISSCPRKCQCIWRDSKITVDCSDQELAAIPTTVEANTQVSNNIYAMSLLTAWTFNDKLVGKYCHFVLYFAYYLKVPAMDLFLEYRQDCGNFKNSNFLVEAIYLF